MGEFPVEITFLWETISNFTPNEGIEINPCQIWPTFLSSFPSGGKLLETFICDPHISTCNQQGSLFLFYNEIYKIWDKRTATKFTLATGKKKEKDMKYTDLWDEKWKDSWRPVKTKDIHQKIFHQVFGNGLQLNVQPLSMMSDSDPKILWDRPKYQHDRFVLLLINENGVDTLYKLTLSYGMDLYKCHCPLPDCRYGNHSQISTLFDEGAQVKFLRCEATLSKFSHRDPKVYYDALVNLTLHNRHKRINEFHQEALTDEKENNEKCEEKLL